MTDMRHLITLIEGIRTEIINEGDIVPFGRKSKPEPKPAPIPALDDEDGGDRIVSGGKFDVGDLATEEPPETPESSNVYGRAGTNRKTGQYFNDVGLAIRWYNGSVNISPFTAKRLAGMKTGESFNFTEHDLSPSMKDRFAEVHREKDMYVFRNSYQHNDGTAISWKLGNVKLGIPVSQLLALLQQMVARMKPTE